MVHPRYTTITDLEYQQVRPALGEFVEEYDTEAIAHEIATYIVETDEDGNELLNTAGLEVTVSDPEFWEICQKHAY